MKKSQSLRKQMKFFGILCGGLLFGLPAIPIAARAQQQTTPKINPCPSIFYAEPHNSQVGVPQGCPPNAYTRQQMKAQGQSSDSSVPNPSNSNQMQPDTGGVVPSGNQSQSSKTRQSSTTIDSGDGTSIQQTQSSVIQTQQQPSVAMVTPTDGRVTVKLVNRTNAPVSYQAIGDTAPRTLQGKSDVVLRGLRIPATVTFHRRDSGLLMVTPQSGSNQQGMLQLTLQETTDLGMDRSALRIERSGAVFLN